MRQPIAGVTIVGHLLCLPTLQIEAINQVVRQAVLRDLSSFIKKFFLAEAVGANVNSAWCHTFLHHRVPAIESCYDPSERNPYPPFSPKPQRTGDDHALVQHGQ